MRRSGELFTFNLLFLISTTPAWGQVSIQSPGSPPSQVDADGSLIEPWGTVRLGIVEPKGAEISDHHAEEAPMPVAVTRTKAGCVRLTQSAYRAPIWPSGADVLEVVVETTAETTTQVQLELVVPAEMQLGETVGTIRGQPAIALPTGLPIAREEREWGCAGGVSALPGWARPNRPCDEGFRNIAAGMGGVPITYRFAVEPGSKRTVMLGFCESHHPSAGLRPLLVQVEGVEDRSIDPIAAWGRHVPGVERFDASDADGDGRLEVSVSPHPRASDRNPILNVLWMFGHEVRIDENKLITGELNDRAERYVDVGGDHDQLLYKPGNVRFVFGLPPREEREFFFLVRSPDCRQLPNLSEGLWNKVTLRKAAADVWKDRWEEPAAAETPSIKPQ